MAAFAALSYAQSSNPFFSYLPVLREYLELSQSQTESIARANEEHDQWTWGKQLRLAQVQREIWQERERTSPDPAALGVRMLEIEAICRELGARVTDLRAKLTALLTEAQQTKLRTLQQALRLVPAIQQAQTVKLLDGPYVAYSGAIFIREAIPSGDAFSRTDGTRLGGYPDAACSPTVFPGNIIPAARITPAP